MNLKVKKLTEDAILPVKAHTTDSGFDLFANEDVIIGPGETVVVKTGIAIELPECHEAQIRPKSGITSKTKLRVQLGTIDESYRGEIGVIVDNIKKKKKKETWTVEMLDGTHMIVDEDIKKGSYKIRKGDKIAQMVIASVGHPKLVVVDELSDTERGEGGFGSTGVEYEGGTEYGN